MEAQRTEDYALHKAESRWRAMTSRKKGKAERKCQSILPGGKRKRRVSFPGGRAVDRCHLHTHTQ
jgi:hypothetical protein